MRTILQRISLDLIELVTKDHRLIPTGTLLRYDYDYFTSPIGIGPKTIRPDPVRKLTAGSILKLLFLLLQTPSSVALLSRFLSKNR